MFGSKVAGARTYNLIFVEERHIQNGWLNLMLEKERFVLLILFILTFFFSSILLVNPSFVSSATVPVIITYQGKLLVNNSSATTTRAMGFLIYDASTNGNLIYTAGGTLSSTSTINVTPNNGIFSVNLGDTGTNSIPTSTFSNYHTLYLEVIVAGQVLTPRKRITTVPYAINSEYLMGISATSTSSSTYIPVSDQFGNFILSGNSRSTAVSGGLIYINPTSSINNGTMFGIAINNVEKFKIDKSGNVFVSGTLKVNNGVNIVSSTITIFSTSTLSTTTIAGRLGIGSTDPGALLTINNGGFYSATSGLQLTNGTQTGSLLMASAAGSIALTSYESDVIFNAGTAGEVMRIIGAGIGVGNVGIGTTTPRNFKLEVAGNIGPADEYGGIYNLGSASHRWGDLYTNLLSVGKNGFFIASSSASNVAATTTLWFSHHVAFISSSTDTGSSTFIFDTATALAEASGNYLFSVRNANNPKFSVSTNGDVKVLGNLSAVSALVGTPGAPGDLSERVDISPDDTVEAGDVMIVDTEHNDTYRRSNTAYQSRVAGVIASNPTIVVGFGKTEHTANMAMVGRVPVKVSSENGPIHRGDLLVSASAAGYAMRYNPETATNNAQVSIVGMALEEFEQTEQNATGKIMSLIRSSWVSTNQQQTISQISQTLTSEAEASGININNQNPEDLTIVGNTQSIIDLNNKSIINVASIKGSNNRWEIDSFGRFITRVETVGGQKALYAIQSDASEYVISGSSVLENGEKRIDFDAETQDLIDRNNPIRIVATPSNDSHGVFVSAKDYTGFTVKESGGGANNIAFDWIMVAARRIDGVISAVPEVVQEENETQIQPTSTESIAHVESQPEAGPPLAEELHTSSTLFLPAQDEP